MNNAAVGIARSQLSLGESWEQDAEDAAAEITEMAENVEEVIRMILVGEKGSLAEAVDKEKKGVQRLLRYVPVDVDDDEAT